MKSIPILLALVSLSLAWVSVAPMPAPRYSSSAVVIGDEAFILGGSEVGGVKSPAVFVYHQCRNDWTGGDPMLIARHRFGAAAVGSVIYVFGGWGNGGTLLDSAECYEGGAWSAIAGLGTPRGSLMGAAVYARVFAIGGWNGSTAFSTVEEYDPVDNAWLPRAPMPTARAEAAVASCGGYIYVIGGTTNGSDVLDVVEVYDPLGDSWFTGASIPTARLAAGCVEVGGNICVFGGVGPGPANTRAVELYDPAADAWTVGTPLPSLRRYLTGFSLFGTRVYAVGGLDSLMQPLALNERGDLPLGLAELPGTAVSTTLPTTFTREGRPVRSPFAPGPYRLSVCGPDGRVVGRSSGSDDWPCADLAAGIYLLHWQGEGRALTTRLVVAR